MKGKTEGVNSSCNPKTVLMIDLSEITLGQKEVIPRQKANPRSYSTQRSQP